MKTLEKLKLKTKKIHKVEVDGETFYFKRPTAGQSQQLMELKDDFLTGAVAMCLVEADGTLVFGIEELETVKELDAETISTIALAIVKGDEKKQ